MRYENSMKTMKHESQNLFRLFIFRDVDRLPDNIQEKAFYPKPEPRPKWEHCL